MPAMTANRASTAIVVHPVPSVWPSPSLVQAEETVVDVLRDRRAILAEPETPVVPDRKVRLVNPAEMETQANRDQPVPPDRQAIKQAMAEPVKKDNPAAMLKMENVDPLDPRAQLDNLVPLARQATEVRTVVLALLRERQVRPVQPATQETMEHPEIPVREASQAGQAKIAITVPVLVTTAKRRSKLKLKLKLTTLPSFLLHEIFFYFCDKRIMSDFYLFELFKLFFFSTNFFILLNKVILFFFSLV